MDAYKQGLLGEMLFVIARGASCILQLDAHTNEGGYAKRAFMCADYPRPCGWINAAREPNKMNIFCCTHGCYQKCHALADSLELLLQCAGLLHDAEPLARSTMNVDSFATIIEPEPGADTTERARPRIYLYLNKVLQDWKKHAKNRLAVWQGLSADTKSYPYENTWESYLNSDCVDQCLKASEDNNGILPYCWVEACGVNLDLGGCRLPGPGGVNNVRDLVYFQTDVATCVPRWVHHPGREMLSEDEYGCVNGDRELYRIKHWQLREQGMTYLCHPRFTFIENNSGLSALKFRLADSATNILANEVNFSRDARKETTVEEKLWRRSHCPVPFNGEVSIVGNTFAGLVCARSVGTNFFGLTHHATMVNVTVSPLYITDDEDTEITQSTNRSIAALDML